MQTFTASILFAPPSEQLRFLPEGPRLLQCLPGTLGWVAIQHGPDIAFGSFNLLDLATLENRSIPLPGRPGFFAETQRPGVVLLGLERRLAYCNIFTGEVEETGITVTTHPRTIINDGLPVDGGVFFGTKHLDFNQPIAELYFFNTQTRELHTVAGGQTCSNGKFFRRGAAGATLIDIDSTPKAVTRYRLDSTLRRVLASEPVVKDPDRLPGYPDGLRPSPDGESVLIAFFNPAHVSDGRAQLIRLDTGEPVCEWILPGSPRVTCPEWIQTPDGKVRVLFTTATEGMPPETRAIAPGAGCLYIADTPFTTLPDPPPTIPLA